MISSNHTVRVGQTDDLMEIRDFYTNLIELASALDREIGCRK